MAATGGGSSTTTEWLKKVIDWSLEPYEKGITVKKLKKHERENANKKEREWGNSMIGQSENGNWTTQLGEKAVGEILKLKGETPTRITKACKKDCYEPDWETENAVYEVKTRNWTTSGTAGEKALGTPYKYANIPKLYGKPLKIVCIAYQEWEFTYENTKVFGDSIGEIQKEFIEFYKSKGIEFIPFSEFVKDIMDKLE